MAKKITPWTTEDATALARAFDERFKQSLVVPPDHEYEFDIPYGVRWFSGANGIQSSMSAYIRRAEPDMYDPDQVYVEIRFFPDRPEAMLFVSQGKQYNFLSTDLLEGKEAFVKGDTYEAVAELAIERVNTALARRRVVRCGYQTGEDTCSKPGVAGHQRIDCAHCDMGTAQAQAAAAAHGR